jgi:signal transduction histidine kinase
LERLVGNLVDNVVRYNHPKGTVAVYVGPTQSTANLRIENTGPAVDEAEVSNLVTPFQRGSYRRREPGYGLGLAIARAITLAHGGSLEIRARLGGGLLVEVGLPLPSLEVPAGLNPPFAPSSV